MASINRCTFSGRLGGDAVDCTKSSGFTMRFNLNIGTGNGTTLWVMVYWSGKKAEAIFDDMVHGEFVVVDGALGPRDASQSGPVIVNANHIVSEDNDGLSVTST